MVEETSFEGSWIRRAIYEVDSESLPDWERGDIDSVPYQRVVGDRDIFVDSPVLIIGFGVTNGVDDRFPPFGYEVDQFAISSMSIDELCQFRYSLEQVHGMVDARVKEYWKRQGISCEPVCLETRVEEVAEVANVEK